MRKLLGHLYRLHCHGQMGEAGENPLLQKTDRGVRPGKRRVDEELTKPSSKRMPTALQRLSMTKADIMSFEALLGQLQGRERERKREREREREKERKRKRERVRRGERHRKEGRCPG